MTDPNVVFVLDEVGLPKKGTNSARVASFKFINAVERSVSAIILSCQPFGSKYAQKQGF